MQDPLIEIVGTIFIVEPVTFDVRSGTYLQKIILENSLSINNVESVPSRLMVSVNSISPIAFKVNDPITVKGMFHRMPFDQLSYMYDVRAPQGYIRYNGQILR